MLQSHQNDKLGEGSYGCVLRGTIGKSKKDINNRNYHENLQEVGQVTKLMLDKNSFSKEVQNTRIANRIDGRRYSIKIMAHSVLMQEDIKQIIENNQRIYTKINQCKNISDSINSINSLYLIVYKDEGRTVMSINVPAEHMISLCYNLYEGLKLYESKRFLHYDVKYDNILYVENEDKKGKLVFIDFGLSSYTRALDLSYVQYFLSSYQNYFLYEPPELIAYAVCRYSQLDKEQMFELFQKIYEHNLLSKVSITDSYQTMIINNIYKGSKELYMNALRTLFNNVYNLSSSQSSLDQYIRRQIYYVDMYKLSMTMLDIFKMHNYLHQNPKLVSNFYMKIVFKALAINPAERLPIKELCSIYNAFLSNPDLKDATYIAKSTSLARL